MMALVWFCGALPFLLSTVGVGVLLPAEKHVLHDPRYTVRCYEYSSNRKCICKFVFVTSLPRGLNSQKALMLKVIRMLLIWHGLVSSWFWLEYNNPANVVGFMVYVEVFRCIF